MGIRNFIFAPLHEAAEKARLKLIQSLDQLAKSADFSKMIEAYNQHIEGMSANIKKIVETALSAAKDDLEKAEALGALGWTIPSIATLAEFSSLLNRSHDINSADQAFTDFYIQDNQAGLKILQQRLLDCPDFHSWKPALEEAILDLDDNRYRSCTALLLPLIEGATLFIFPKFKFNDLEKLFKKKFEELEANNQGKHIIAYQWRAYRSFAKVFFHRCNSRPSIINRHWLLHGHDIPSSNLSDCLRLLQALETIGHLK